MPKQIIVDIGDEGEIKIETRGYRGKACIEETNFLKTLLGEEISRQLTPAYYTRTSQKKVVKKHLPLCG
ncbi:DUF2997 domain-containing protein [Desulfoferrobacter suflitae]|uniref:DUF2997 domain-containing protein n=1 Tax=Desulfoferrobacter suflitae TaxID=2865782 RepID=UPI00216414B1|nr:DUF2997 domain-containing protein [Desulfoferrobacter suflitae]MCK8600095.1 DUF2997 domain-containing protein [Desulfoferrobacter suflitae]